MIAPQPPQDKSVGVALVLTFLLGPLGMFYVAKWYEAVMLTIAEMVLIVFTLGLIVLVAHPAFMVWSAWLASKRHTEFQTYLAGIGAAACPPQIEA